MTLLVREAVDGDLNAVAEVHVSSWEGAYRGMVPDQWLDARTVEGQLTMWRNALGGPQRTLLLVAEHDGDGRGDGSGEGDGNGDRPAGIIGFCSANLPSRDDDADEDTAEIATLYVEPTRWREGAGAALMEAMLGRLAAAGFESATLWVLEPNVRARAFYTRAGFGDDGGRQELAPGWPLELRLRRALG